MSKASRTEPEPMNRLARAILLAVVAGTLAIGAEARGRNNSSYDGEIEFEPQLLYLVDGCAAVEGTVSSGSFFDGLKRIDADSQLEFRRDGKVVTEYPESVTTSIRIVGDQCGAALSNAPSAIFHGNSYSVRFEVEWKQGMQLRPASLSTAAPHCVGFSSIPIPHQDFTIPSITCQLTVQSKGVPLGDHLIVSVFSADGKRLTRLSAGP
jgi:hypothetical protein